MDIKLDSTHDVRILFDGDKVTGLVEYHISSVHGGRCGGIVPIEDGEWVLINLDPLTVLPSINCTECNSHYSIIAGKVEDNRTDHEIHMWKQRVQRSNEESQNTPQ